MTGGIFELSDEEWAVVDPSADLVIQGSDIEAAGLAELVSGCVLVYSTDDDYSRYRFAVTALKAMDRSRGVKTYTILPTTACNARCVYCYEQGMKVSTMSESTADKVIDFILKTMRSDEITLCWFGGEPLVAANIINRICTGLNEKGVSFKSRIITNASLFTPELLDTAVNVWHLKRAQVSVDGSKSDYEARKLFCSPKIHNYEYLLKTIGIMLDAGLEVTLRCNFDQGNIEGMYSFWEDINNLYGDSDKLRVYSSMLFQAQKDPSCIDLHKRYLELRTEAAKKGMKFLRF
ncbi:MAG: radical SAM protein, partial [Clostridiales bacterium]|nr:radical SAM protein [Clostridiales bacterium]